MAYRVRVLADGPPAAAHTNSGVSRGLLRALEESSGFDVTSTIDTSFTRADRLINRALSFRLSPYWWDRAASWGLSRPLIRSIKRSRACRHVAPGEVIVHVRNFYFPSRHRYVPFLDTTLSLRERHWPEPELRRRHYLVLQILERFYYHRAWLIFVAGEHVKRELTDFYGVSPDKVAVVGAGAGVEVNNPPRSSSKSPGDVTIIFVGKEFGRKGGADLVRALEELAGEGVTPELWVVGPVEEVPTPAGVRVTAFGRMNDKKKLSELYAQADIFCLPALFEPYGLVVIEALAHGLPVILSDVGSLPEILGGSGAGLVVPARDPRSLAEAVRKLTADDELRKKMSENALSRSKEFSWDRVAGTMLANFDAHFAVSSGGS